MAHTNSTTHYSLPQFLTSDKPAWLTDINNAFSDIDTAMYNAQSKANNADTNAAQALLDAADASSAASAADAKGSGAIASLADTFQTTETYAVGELVIYNSLLYICTVAVSDPGAWTGSTNWSRITLEGVIDALDASDIEYSTGVTVKDAIDDLNTPSIGACNLNATNTLGGSVSYVKTGNLITVGGYVYTKGTWSNTPTALFELPYKPLIDLNPAAQTVISGDAYKATYLNVSSSFFNVRLDNSVENNQLLRFGFTYIANI